MPDRKETLKTEQPNDHDSNRLLIHMCAYRRRKPGVVSGLEKHHHCKNVSFSRRNSELTWRLKLLLKEPKKKKASKSSLSRTRECFKRSNAQKENAHTMLFNPMLFDYNAKCAETYLSQCSSVSACFQASTPPETPCSSTVQCPLLTFINQFSRIAVNLGPWRRVNGLMP